MSDYTAALGSPAAELPVPAEGAMADLAPAATRTRAAVRQLVRLRWLAICGVLGVVVVSHSLLHAVEFPIPLYLIAAAMAAANVIFELTSRRLAESREFEADKRLGRSTRDSKS